MSTRWTRSSFEGSCRSGRRSSLAALACSILALFAPVLALVLLAALSLGGIALPLAVRHLAHRPAERMIRARADLYTRFADDLSGLADLLVFGRDGRLAGDLVTRSSAIGREQRTLAFIRGGSAAAGAVLAGSAGLAVLALAIPWVRSADLEGVFLASLPLVAFAAYEAVLPLGDAFREVEASRAAAVRTFEIVDAPATVAEPSHPHAPPAHPSLEFRSVRFRYEEGSPLVLDDLSFSVRPGEALGITGPSGAGKTTLVNLLLRFWDVGSGGILLDGLDVRSFRADDVRSLVGVVPQQIYLFNGTLRDNLLLADGEADDDRIAEACDRARLGGFLRSLPAGLETLVGEDGLKLSGGERQRVAIARAFLKDAPILVLDEATANLDLATEADVLENLRVSANDKTLLVISHRRAPLGLADRMITLPAPARRHPVRADVNGSRS